MEAGLKSILQGFGFSWTTVSKQFDKLELQYVCLPYGWKAPGEAEAELAYLNRTGVIDGVMSDDVDAVLFKAKLVIRK